MTPPLSPSPLHLLAQPAWVKALIAAVIFIPLSGVFIAIWLLLTPEGRSWLRRFRERRRIGRSLRATRWG